MKKFLAMLLLLMVAGCGSPTLGVVKATRFELVDSHGDAVAKLGMDETGVHLILRDANTKKMRVFLGVGEKVSFLSFRDPKGEKWLNHYGASIITFRHLETGESIATLDGHRGFRREE